METSQSLRKARSSRGFTLLEVVAAAAILVLGLLGIAAMMNRMALHTNESRYQSDEALLVSEKLEDLNRYPTVDRALLAGGSLTNNVSLPNPNGTVTDYFDQVQISTSNGSSVEITTGKDTNGNPNYTQLVHTPNGGAQAKVIPGPPPAPTPDMLVFNRRWLIEQDVPIAGVRRVTVIVSLANNLAGQAGAASFQATMVRP